MAEMRGLTSKRAFLGLCCVALVLPCSFAAAAAPVQVGAAKVDVTPAEPIRLTGYASRKKPSEGVEQKLWAKALAIGSDREGPAVLITLDNCGIADETYREVRARLAKSAKLRPDKIVIACSHTHSGPVTKNWAPNLFVQDLPAEQQAVIDRYTVELITRLEQVALQALKNRRPARLSWSQGSVSFAKNRRVVRGQTAVFGDNAAGPVDHALPVLKAEDADGRLLAFVANYACHCTTLGGEFNHVCGDWAGYAQEAIERDHPGAVALITIGCGADANPSPRGGADFGLVFAKQHGDEIAAELKRLLGQNFTPLTGKLAAHAKEIALPFGPHFTRDQWLARSTNSGIVGYHAKKWLARLDRGEKLPDKLYYPITTWNFGDDLALVFLPGEVVVDYALRLKRELDPQRLWVTAYANYVPCYIPSRRILAEGGYEAEDSLWYYDRPARISTNAEDLIIRTAEELVPKSFRTDPKKAELPDPKSPQQALGTFRTKAGFVVELVASEPLIESPVAIDWDAQGRLWVCEMYDYPTGIAPVADVGRKYGENPKSPPGGFKPGGRIKVLTDTNGDGRFDKATLFLDGLPFPTGVMAWNKGVLVCAAPDILYAEDTDGDGKGDKVVKLFTGFATHNYQARVNGFTWGLDGWLHGSSGLFGGKIRPVGRLSPGATDATRQEVDLSGRDFRFKPETGEIEPVSGLSQMGRVRDDFGNWYGNDNSTLLWHYPLPDHYVRRNPHVAYPDPRVNVSFGVPPSGGIGARPPESGTPNRDPNKLFPASHTLERFNDPQAANRVTGACGPCIYRDDLLGAGYYGNAFICEPVHDLVHRLPTVPNGVTFAGSRALDEERAEFLASTDNWSRPVQVRTGPDGALWVVDMYRFVIEHPRWIPPERLAKLDVRAGADQGRIYRVYPLGKNPRPICDLTKLSTSELAVALDSPNGTERDRVHLELLRRNDLAATRPLVQLVQQRDRPAVRLQALWVLDGLKTLPAGLLEEALADSTPAIRRHAIQLSEPLLRLEKESVPASPVVLESKHGPQNRAASSPSPPLLEERAGERRVSKTSAKTPLPNPLPAAQGEGAKQPVATPSLTSKPVAASPDSAAAKSRLDSVPPHQAHLGAALLQLANDSDPTVRFQLALSLGEWSDPRAAQALSQLALAGLEDSWMRAAVLSSASRHAGTILQAIVSTPAAAKAGDFIAKLIATAVGAGDPRTLQAILRTIAPNTDVLTDAQAGVAREPWRLEAAAALLEAFRRNGKDFNLRAANWDAEFRPAAGRIELLIQCAGKLAQDQKADDAVRELAIRVLAQWDNPLAVRIIGDDVLGRAGSLRLQRAAVVALARSREEGAAGESMLNNWQRLSPMLRGQVFDALLSRESWQRRLLDSVEEGRIAPGEVPATGRQRLVKSANAAVHERAARIFAAQTTAARADVVAKYRGVAGLTARADNGAAVFDKNCAQCHAFRGQGQAVGPNLVEFAGKSVQDFLVAILDPNAAINPAFLAYNLETRDGRSLTGIVRGETASGLTLAQANSVEEKILRSDIQEIRASQLSLMPEGLEQAIAPQDLADLIAWIKQSAPAPFGSATPEQAAQARAQFLAAGGNGPGRIVVASEQLPYPSWLGTLPLAHCRQTDGQSKLIWQTTPVPADGRREEVQRFRLPVAMGFVSQPAGCFQLKFNGKTRLTFDVALNDATWLSDDGNVRMTYTVMQNNSEDSNGILIVELKDALLEPGRPATFEVIGSAAGSQRWFGIYQLN